MQRQGQVSSPLSPWFGPRGQRSRGGKGHEELGWALEPLRSTCAYARHVPLRPSFPPQHGVRLPVHPAGRGRSLRPAYAFRKGTRTGTGLGVPGPACSLADALRQGGLAVEAGALLRALLPSSPGLLQADALQEGGVPGPLRGAGGSRGWAWACAEPGSRLPTGHL